MYKIRVYIVPDSLKSRSISHQTLHEHPDENAYNLGDLYSSLSCRTLSANTLCEFSDTRVTQNVEVFRNFSDVFYSDDKVRNPSVRF
ncbi:hypothetical protein WDU94_013627 [Cyamophila willieti]